MALAFGCPVFERSLYIELNDDSRELLTSKDIERRYSEKKLKNVK
jgi:hypothetical protein